MYPTGIDIVWDAPVEDGGVKVIVCYLILFMKIL
jgi:hypothetical protein